MTAKQKTTGSYGLLALALARVSLGFIFLWAFFDKLLGLGFATCRDAKTDSVSAMCSKAWVEGGSPVDGFLKFATKGPLADFYQSLVGNQVIAWLFMLGLLLIGVSLVLGIGMRLATLSGAILMLMMWSAVLPPENNPVFDDHIVYIFVLLALGGMNRQQVLGLRSWWVNQSLVKRFPILE